MFRSRQRVQGLVLKVSKLKQKCQFACLRSSGTVVASTHAQTEAKALSEDEVVVSGFSGRFPESDNVAEFRDNLINGRDMVTDNNRRWEPGVHGLPSRNGKLKDISKFDASFFGVHPKQANGMDPQLRLLLEVSYEALIDAGINPQTVRGSRTGVFIGCSASEAHNVWSADAEKVTGYEMTGCTRSMFANRLSYFFDFKGPSFAIDTACSSSLLALDQALRSIRTGQCDAAVVGGTSLCLQPSTSAQFNKLNMLSVDGACKAFDATGAGYVRSEAVVAVYLQKKSTAKRVYASLVHSKTNSDGFKVDGITFPSGEMQKRLLNEVYQEAGVDPSAVSYFELHGTGTQAGDPQEANSVADVCCGPNRKTPLLIGSTKSNMGHPEPASGLAALAKVLISMHDGAIPPNLHFRQPNPKIPALADGRFKVVDKLTSWKGGYAGISSFGFGGSNVHVLLRSADKQTTSSSEETGSVAVSTASSAKQHHPAATVPRLVTVAGRTKEGVEKLLHEALHRPNDVQLQSLLESSVGQAASSTHPYRGFALVNSPKPWQTIEKFSTESRPVWFVFSGMGTQWPQMGKDLMGLEIFRNSIMRSDAALKSVGLSVHDLIMNSTESTFNEATNSFVGLASIQMALVDVLRSLGVNPDGLLGHSVGELGCAYADGAMTAEETVQVAYWRGRSLAEANLPLGGMAAVGMTWEEAQRRCPKGIVPACHNSHDTVTISGPAEDVARFVAELQKEGIFAKEVDSAGNAFHSYFMEKAAPNLRKHLEKILAQPKPRSSRWISTSVAKPEWGSELARAATVDYWVNNLVSPVLFQDALGQIPNNAIVVEIAPHSLLQAVLRRGLSSGCSIVGLMDKRQPDNHVNLLQQIGKLHLTGLNFNPLALYPPVELPVSPETPMISSLVRWDHSDTWEVPTAPQFLALADGASGGRTAATVDIDIAPGTEDEYISGHVIDGRILYPATGYLVLAWKQLAKSQNQKFGMSPVAFEDVSIHRATIIPPAGAVKLDVSVTAGTGRFEVCDNGALVASGKVYFTQPPQPQQPADGSKKNPSPATATASTQQLKMNADDVYKELRLRGYDYGKTFKGILSVDNTGTDGELSWNGNWVPFLDAMLQMQVFSHPGRDLRLPTRLRYLRINPQTHEEHVRQGEHEGLKVIAVHNNQTLGTCTAGGVELLDLHATAAPRRHGAQPDPMLETYQFVPYEESNLAASVGDLTNYSEACTRLAVKHLQRLVNGYDKLHIGLMNGELTKILLKNTPVKPQPLDQTAAANFLDRPLYATLQKLIEIPHDSKFIDGSKTVTSAAVGDIFSDQLTKFARSDRMFKTCMDVVLENLSVEGSETSLKIVELEAGIGQAYRHAVSQLATQPGVTVNYVAATEPSSLSNISADLVERFRITPVGWSLAAGSSKPPVPETVSNADLVIATDVLHRQTDLVAALSSASNLLKPGGFLLFVEPTKNFAVPWSLGGLTTDVAKLTDVSARTFGPYCDEKTWTKLIGEAGLEPIARKSDGLVNTVFLARKLVAPSNTTSASEPVIMEVEDRAFSWLEHVKGAMESEEVNGGNRDSVWLRAERSPTNGIVGMINCLRREPNGHRLRCLYNASCGFNQSVGLPEADLQAVFKKDLVMNVYRSGQWGSFRHMPLESGHTVVNTDKAYINVLTRGDLSSLRWIESPVKYFNPVENPDKELCHVAYTALNFRDIMLATGKLPPDAIPGDLASQDCLLGMEFSGHDAFGRRVMGLLAAKGLATVVDAPRKFLWQVPDGWTLEQAATVPVAYSTAYYSLMIRGGLRRGETVLIHSGSGAVGQAAISIALNHGCRVLTTVGSLDKRANLRQRFPQLVESSFADSRDPEFWRTILQSTNGRGVDVVLNSLAEDKLQSSVQLLAQHGRFLEIGKFDLSNNSPLGMAVFLRNVSFHGILLDALFETGNPDWQTVYDHVLDGIKSGVVQPLQTTVYGHDDVENAFRFMAQGKHIGKVLIKVQEEADVMSGKKLVIPAVARTVCNPRRSYVIVGGLGGFGLEMAGWLVERGARHLVLTSRGGIRTGYQERRVREMRDAGVDVQVSTRNVSDPNEAMALIGEAATMPGVEGVGGVFNLAVVLEDGLTANQTTEQWIRATQPKVAGTENLDAATRKLCGKTLDWFVVFSSVSCGRGNAGQANYGFANSVMERICEQRRSEGLAGQAIQWGAIGDVGVAFDLLGGNQDASIGGTLPQRINSCLSTLDSFLSRPEAVVSSFVLAETSRGRKSEAAGAGGASLRDSVAHILGIKDPTSVNVDATLGDLGLDSLMGVEIKQTLERNFDITLSAKEIRSLTFARLDELSSGKPKTESGTEAAISQPVPSADIRYQLKHLMPTEEMVKLNSYEGSAETPVFVVTPIDGSVLLLESLMSRVNVGQVYGLQCTESTPLTSVADMANEYIKRMKAVSPTGPYRIIGYSFGASVAIEMALQLQQEQSVVSKLVLLDGSQSFVSAYTARTRERLTIGAGDTNTAETTAICAFIMQTAVRLAENKEAATKIDIVKLAGDLMRKTDWRSRVDHTVQLLVDAGIVSSDAKPTLTAAVTAFYRKLEVSEKYQPTLVLSPSTQVTLIRAADNTVQRETLGDDYSLRNVTSGDVTVHVVNGSHESFILSNEGVASVSPLINAALS